MNLILCAASELRGQRLCLRDGRARHCLEVLRVRPGETVRLGVVDGGIGSGLVLSCGPDWVELELHLGAAPAPAPALDLILALPRPIMLQRILKQAAVFGVRRLLLVHASRVEKSFWQSKVLAPERTQALLLEGLAQAGVDTRLPRVSLHRSFRRFVGEELPALTADVRLLAHPLAAAGLADLRDRLRGDSSVMLAVGPEGGWIEPEVASFAAQGFAIVSLGPRILHVDGAVLSLLAQIGLLRQLAPRDDNGR